MYLINHIFKQSIGLAQQAVTLNFPFGSEGFAIG